MTPKLTPALLVCFDLLALVLAFCGGYVLADITTDLFLDGNFMRFGGREMKPWLWLFVAEMVGIIIIFNIRGHYSQRTPWWGQVKHMFMVSLTMLLLSATIMYVFKYPFSRMWLFGAFVWMVPSLIIMRHAARSIALALKIWGEKVTIIGGYDNVLETLFALNSDTYNHFDVREIVLVGADEFIPTELLPERQRGCKQVIKGTDELEDIVAHPSSTLFIVAPDEHTKIDIPAFVKLVQSHGKNVAIVPVMSGMSLYGMDVQHFFGSHTVLLKPSGVLKSR